MKLGINFEGADVTKAYFKRYYQRPSWTCSSNSQC